MSEQTVLAYEYKLIDESVDLPAEARLNELGSQGWDLMTAQLFHEPVASGRSYGMNDSSGGVPIFRGNYRIRLSAVMRRPLVLASSPIDHRVPSNPGRSE